MQLARPAARPPAVRAPAPSTPRRRRTTALVRPLTSASSSAASPDDAAPSPSSSSTPRLPLHRRPGVRRAAVAASIALLALAIPKAAAKQAGSGSAAKSCCGGGGGGGKGGGGGGGGGGDGGGSGRPGASTSAATPGETEEEARRRKANAPKAVTLTLVSFAVTRKAYARLTEMFSERYKAQTGVTVRWRLSFGGSGTQARAVCDGLPGDIAALALPLDIDRIADAGLLPKDWRDRAPNGGIVSESVVGIVTRPGNPARIKSFADLARPGLSVVTANPKTAGVARWNFLALWQHGLDGGVGGMKKGALAPEAGAPPDPKARAFVKAVLQNVPIMPRDAREASDAFYAQNKGDALLNYENEIISTNEAGDVEEPLPYVVPADNVRVTMPVALVTANLDRFPAHSRGAAKDAAQAFLEFLFTPEAQAEFVAAGFRPVRPLPKGGVRGGSGGGAVVARKFPKVKRLVDVDAHMGGWDAVQARFFANGSLLDDLQNELSGR